jgi:hypothetical protein
MMKAVRERKMKRYYATVNHNAFVTGLLSLTVRSWVTEYGESFESYLN